MMNPLEKALREALAEIDRQRQEVLDTMNYYGLEDYPDGQVVQLKPLRTSTTSKADIARVLEEDPVSHGLAKKIAPLTVDGAETIKPRRGRPPMTTLSDARQQLHDAVAQAPEGLSVNQLAEIVGKRPNAVATTLGRMIADGQMVRPRPSVYQLPDKKEPKAEKKSRRVTGRKKTHKWNAEKARKVILEEAKKGVVSTSIMNSRHRMPFSTCHRALKGLTEEELLTQHKDGLGFKYILADALKIEGEDATGHKEVRIRAGEGVIAGSL